MLDQATIASMLPHGDGMTLIEQVIAYDKTSIECSGVLHTTEHHPLFLPDNYASIIGVEYAAQAIAVHAGLNSSGIGDSGPAYIGALKNIEILHQQINVKASELSVKASAEHLSASGAIYTFSFQADGRELLKGRIVLVQP